MAAAGDTPLNFYFWAAMGGAAMAGLGLALAQPRRRVLVVTGDGEMLMGLGSLATIGAEQPSNLGIVVLDNEHYGETGMQVAHTGRGVDLAGIAAATGFKLAVTIRTEAEVESLAPQLFTAARPLFAAVKVSTDSEPDLAPPARRRLPPEPLSRSPARPRRPSLGLRGRYAAHPLSLRAAPRQPARTRTQRRASPAPPRLAPCS